MHRRRTALALAALPLLALAAAAAASSAPPAAAPTTAQSDGETDDLRERYETLANAGDRAGLVALWKRHPGMALVTFDTDLERGLALWEEAEGDPPTDEIERLHARALLAAEAASEALGTPILADYAAAFVGWTDQERRDFRDGQDIVRAAHHALDQDDAVRAGDLAWEAVQRTVHLGDWWGRAMALAVRGRALQASSSFDDALAAYAEARLLYHQLHLYGGELTSLRRMVNMLVLGERWERARIACAEALALAERTGAEQDVRDELERARAKIADALGDGPDADGE